MSAPRVAEAVKFRCATDELLGVIEHPERPCATGVVFVTGGPQTRIGSHRQFVTMARALAEAGFPTLRFDQRGSGDSDGEPRSFDALAEDVRAAIDCLFASVNGIERVVLAGLCDGASAALLYAPQDPRVGGLVLFNPWVRRTQTLARTHLRFYYPRRLVSADFWRGLLRGDVDIGGALRASLASLRAAAGSADGGGDFVDRMCRAAATYTQPILLVLCGQDLTAREFGELIDGSTDWRRALAGKPVRTLRLPDANHTFSRAAWRGLIVDDMIDWLAKLASTPGASANP